MDLPGSYSLMAHSAEEEAARNFICFGEKDATLVVCDATCLERNLNLVLQILEVSSNVLVCVNLLDEAAKKKIHVDLNKLSELLGVPVIGTVARKKKSLREILFQLDALTEKNADSPQFQVSYEGALEEASALLLPAVSAWGSQLKQDICLPDSRWLSFRLLEGDSSVLSEISTVAGKNPLDDEDICHALYKADILLHANGITKEQRKDLIASGLINCAEKIASQTVSSADNGYHSLDRKLDALLTGKRFGYPAMAGLFALIFWITIVGANYPSQLLSDLFLHFEGILLQFFLTVHAPLWLRNAFVFGIYRVLTWVVAVMLPPMAIFFPLFTLLEDSGYLPRIAYNLDRPFKFCKACGKQALTMAMGFGCNAAGVVGCRIIDSPRERLIAILTNTFVPCNGRLPMLIALSSMFFAGTLHRFSSVVSALLLTVLILLGIGITFLVSKLLSETLLKGTPSSFLLELPPYRRPQIGKVLVRSVFDRTLFVLGRAAAVAAPAGLLIWIMANVTVGGVSLLSGLSSFLDPLGRLLGMDGMILTAFILGFPANEIVIPVLIMAYLSQGTIASVPDLSQLYTLFTAHGWTLTTALCTMLFSLFHWPCSTTLLTIKKETGSLKWTFLAFFIPTFCGMGICFLVSSFARLIS